MYLKSQLNFCFNFNFSGICFIFNFNFNFSGMVAVCAGCDSYYPWNALIVSSGSGFVYLVKTNLKHVFVFCFVCFFNAFQGVEARIHLFGKFLFEKCFFFFLLCIFNMCLPRVWRPDLFIWWNIFENIFSFFFVFPRGPFFFTCTIESIDYQPGICVLLGVCEKLTGGTQKLAI